ncbi:MAG: DNA topoisomerase, partial [Clostridia bacterium]|nr:DNA topoisomerase [Clostridia bacterium]
NDPRAGSLICATDAGREGELIFRLVYALCDCRKPVERLWVSSMEETAIREGFQNLKPSAAYDALHMAALCRAQADWLVGINATRLFSTMYGKTLNIGRVVTPTLSMVVNREAQIASFQPTPFYHVRLECDGFAVQSERLQDRAEAERVAALCMGKDAKVSSLESKEKKENPPRLYDLTSLQRDANRLLGYTAQQTLDYAQALYEKKLCTYPRTDSRFLTEHMKISAIKLVEMIIEEAPFRVPSMFSRNPLKLIDSSKVSDHHAILPTSNVAGADLTSLPAGEQNILLLLMARLLHAVGEPSRTEEITVTVECEGISFNAKASSTVYLGWRSIDPDMCAALKSKPEDQEPQSRLLPMLERDMVFPSVTASVKESQTSPPKHFTEDTLLAAMETAGREGLPEDMVYTGLGTPATRAAILEKLIKTGLVKRKRVKKTTVLLSTDKGASLITVLPEELQSPELTAEWEQRLRQIERGELEPEMFMRDIREMVTKFVDTTQPIKDAHVLFPDDSISIGTCPRCGSQVAEGPKGFSCTNHDCRFALWKDNRFFTYKRKRLTADIAAVLLKEGRMHVKGLYSEKTGKTYDATVVLDDTGDQYVNFKLEF